MTAEASCCRGSGRQRRAQAMARMGHVITLPDGRFESWSENLPSLIGIAVLRARASAA